MHMYVCTHKYTGNECTLKLFDHAEVKQSIVASLFDQTLIILNLANWVCFSRPTWKDGFLLLLWICSLLKPQSSGGSNSPSTTKLPTTSEALRGGKLDGCVIFVSCYTHKQTLQAWETPQDVSRCIIAHVHTYTHTHTHTHTHSFITVLSKLAEVDCTYLISFVSNSNLYSTQPNTERHYHSTLHTPLHSIYLSVSPNLYKVPMIDSCTGTQLNVLAIVSGNHKLLYP